MTLALFGIAFHGYSTKFLHGSTMESSVQDSNIYTMTGIRCSAKDITTILHTLDLQASPVLNNVGTFRNCLVWIFHTIPSIGDDGI